MARPIKETPILFGEDARRFEERMKQVRKETPEQKRVRMESYNMVMQWFENGRKSDSSRFYGAWKDEDFPELDADEQTKEIKGSRKFKDDAMEL